jgi:hypothetical protein
VKAFSILFFSISALAIAACAPPKTDQIIPKITSPDNDITAQSLSKISAGDYISRGSRLSITADGKIDVTYDSDVTYFYTKNAATVQKQQNVRCLMNLSGNVRFFKVNYIIPTSSPQRRTALTISSAQVTSSKPIKNDSAPDYSADYICDMFKNALLEKKDFDSYAADIGEDSLVLTHFGFNIPNKDKSSNLSSYTFTSELHRKITNGDFLIRKETSYIYFLKANKAVDLTETFLNDLNGDYLESNFTDRDIPAEEATALHLSAKNKSLEFTNKLCKLSYKFDLASVSATTEGIKWIVSKQPSAQPIDPSKSPDPAAPATEPLSGACEMLKEKFESLTSDSIRLGYVSNPETKWTTFQIFSDSNDEYSEVFNFLIK